MQRTLTSYLMPAFTGAFCLSLSPSFHKCDETIRGHVFCSLLTLVLRKELQDRLEAKRHDVEWADVIRDLDVPLTLTK